MFSPALPPHMQSLAFTLYKIGIFLLTQPKLKWVKFRWVGSPSHVQAVLPPNDTNQNIKSLHPLVGEFFFDSLLVSYLLFCVLF
ncbi:hypothetical protein VNO80_24496 [Phaseolus coccineus]|uniref:Uncharacterized protein n=1 Tax=Phaseolus coccineus TaxID=3886 RepID=A0AAN9LSX4_PHACN